VGRVVDDVRTPPTVGDKPGRGDGELSRGTLIGRYVVLDRLGAGGMGIVFAGYDPELNRRVAIKLMLQPPRFDDTRKLVPSTPGSGSLVTDAGTSRSAQPNSPASRS